jgi:hypothetical protein
MEVPVDHLRAVPAVRLPGLLPEDLMEPADLRPAVRAVLMADSVRHPSH